MVTVGLLRNPFPAIFRPLQVLMLQCASAVH